MTRKTQTLVWVGFVVAALMCGAVALLVAEPPVMEFKVGFLDDPLGIAITVMVLSNFGLAFAGTTPMAKSFLGRDVAKDRPDYIFTQYFVITLALYELCTTLGLIYVFLRPEIRAPHSLLMIALPLSLAGFVKFLWVDAPELREVVEAIKKSPPESADSVPPETPEETPQSSPR